MRKTKLAVVALAALSSVSVYAAESDFSITPNALFLYSFGEARKKEFKTDNIPHEHAFSVIDAPDKDNGHCSSAFAILAGAHVGYNISESFAVVASGYFGLKPLKYEIKGKNYAATPEPAASTLSYSPHMVLAGVQYKPLSSDTVSFVIGASGGAGLWTFTSVLNKDSAVPASATASPSPVPAGTPKTFEKSLGSKMAVKLAAVVRAGVEFRVNEMISITGNVMYCFLGEPQVNAKFVKKDGTTEDKDLKFGGEIHNIGASVGLGLEF